jgi:hypothetical protein
MFKANSLFLAGVLAVLSTQLVGQGLDLPKNITLKYTVDYATYEPYVAKCVKWIETTPLDQDKDRHSDAYGFLFNWVNGAPNVHVDIQPAFLNIKQKKNFPLLVVYIGEWSLYELKNGDKSNPAQAAMQAIRGAIKVYKKGSSFAKDKNLEKLIALDEKGQLEKFVEANLPRKK